MDTLILPVDWINERLELLDQRYLPLREEIVVVENIADCFDAIKSMVVRGAPCIGYTAILGLALWAGQNRQADMLEVVKAAQYLKGARPTAVNLAYEIDQCLEIAQKLQEEGRLSNLVVELVDFFRRKMHSAQHEYLAMAQFAEKELQNIYGDRPLNLLTHCNTGYLACNYLGTALGVITYLAQKNKVHHVWVDETRPYNQGTRLTSYELLKLNIPHRVVVDSASSYLMREKRVDAVFVGADRIVSNGDTANKIGTSSLAIVCKHYGVPFFVVAPTSSFDLKTENGHGIEIELRNEEEILSHMQQPVGHPKARALNPSFDVTSADLITAIICENGSIRPVRKENVQHIVRGKNHA